MLKEETEQNGAYLEGRGKAERDRGDDDDQRKDEEGILESRDQEHDESSRGSPLTSVFGEVTIFRDFFLAAFADGYNSFACCSDEGLFPGGSEDSCFTANNTATKSHDESIRRSGSYSPSVIKSSSLTKEKNKKKPLAVAVGFNYANDPRGRPIVITPGTRKHPIDLTNSAGSSSNNRRIPIDLTRSRSAKSAGSSRTPPTPPRIVNTRPVLQTTTETTAPGPQVPFLH